MQSIYIFIVSNNELNISIKIVLILWTKEKRKLLVAKILDRGVSS